MSYLYDFGEVIFCMGPIFLVIAAIGLTLLWNSWPPKKSAKDGEEKCK
jgi:hypothetical protein